MHHTRRILAATFAAAALVVAGRSSRVVAMSDAQVDASCRPYYHAACSMAMGKWLPAYGLDGRLLLDSATHVTAHDDFVYEGKRSSPSTRLAENGPFDGTFFVFGRSGPLMGHAVYDRANQIVFFDMGCCSFHQAVLSSDVGPPPKEVVARQLSGIATLRGATLGASEKKIAALYGPSKRLPIPAHPGLVAHAYTTLVPSARDKKGVCGQIETFYFREGRLQQINIVNAC